MRAFAIVQGIDLKAGGRNKKKHRTAPKSENVYLKLLVKVRHHCTAALLALQRPGHSCQESDAAADSEKTRACYAYLCMLYVVLAPPPRSPGSNFFGLQPPASF